MDNTFTDVMIQIMSEGVKTMRIINKKTQEILFDNCTAHKEDYHVGVEVPYRKITKKYLRENFYDIVLIDGKHEYKLLDTMPSYNGLYYRFSY